MNIFHKALLPLFKKIVVHYVPEPAYSYYYRDLVHFQLIELNSDHLRALTESMTVECCINTSYDLSLSLIIWTGVIPL